MKKIIYEDLYRYTGEPFSVYVLLKALKYTGFRYTLIMRLLKIQNNVILKVILRLILRHYQYKFGYQIPYQTRVGGGFYIGHHGHIIINPETKIGKNCNIASGVIIGQTSRGKTKGVPSIGNNVWIGVNSIIVGKINVGSNVLVAPGAYVNFDVPNNSIVIGNPGEIKSSKNATLGYINRVMESDNK